MAQMQWIYAADSGQQYRVDLFHGERSGHVLVTVNDKVSLVDFFVTNSKTYTLLLEEEVFNLEIEKAAEGFRYGFTMDDHADTASNLRKRREKRRQYAIVLLSLAAFFAVAVAGLLKLQSYQDDRLARKSLPYLDEIGVRAMGRFSESDNGGWKIHYIAGVSVQDLTVTEIPAEIPALQAGDDMTVLYLGHKPRIAKVGWNGPGPRRSARLYRAWREATFGPGELSGHPFECILTWMPADSIVLGDPEAPWHRVEEKSLEAWLATRPAVVGRIAAACPLAMQEE